MSPAEVQDWIDNPWPRRVSGQAVMDAIVCDPRFKASSEDELDAIVDAVIAANSDQASKVQDNPKLIQWFVGQVMKAGKGKITAPSVLAKLKQRFAVS